MHTYVRERGTTGDALVPAATPRLVSAYAAELAFEALPQSTLQGYVAISYGKLNPSDPEHFSPLLAGSISISLLGAGATFFGSDGTP